MNRKWLLLTLVVVPLLIGTIVLAQGLLGSLPASVTVVPVTPGASFWTDEGATEPLVKLWLGTEREQFSTSQVTFYIMSKTPADLAFSTDGGPSVVFQPPTIAATANQIYPVTATFTFSVLGTFDFIILVEEQP